MQNQKGYQLTELMIGVGLASAGVLLLGSMITGMGKMSSMLSSKGNMEFTLMNAVRMIKKVGRGADGCSYGDINLKQNSPAVKALVCSATVFNEPSSSLAFIVGVTPLVVYKKENTATEWTTFSTFEKISLAKVCDDNLQKVAGACTIEPPFPYPAAPSITRQLRFFRYQVSVVEMINGSLKELEKVQGSFYVRNPSEVGTNLHYEGG